MNKCFHQLFGPWSVRAFSWRCATATFQSTILRIHRAQMWALVEGFGWLYSQKYNMINSTTEIQMAQNKTKNAEKNRAHPLICDACVFHSLCAIYTYTFEMLAIFHSSFCNAVNIRDTDKVRIWIIWMIWIVGSHFVIVVDGRRLLWTFTYPYASGHVHIEHIMKPFNFSSIRIVWSFAIWRELM